TLQARRLRTTQPLTHSSNQAIFFFRVSDFFVSLQFGLEIRNGYEKSNIHFIVCVLHDDDDRAGDCGWQRSAA
ncbi:MAG: hypothetical protein IKC19_01260, partial [Bacteroidales bacterium]|nr:hypothetical protein [Bacteroidales bacterium]